MSTNYLVDPAQRRTLWIGNLFFPGLGNLLVLKSKLFSKLPVPFLVLVGFLAVTWVWLPGLIIKWLGCSLILSIVGLSQLDSHTSSARRIAAGDADNQKKTVTANSYATQRFRRRIVELENYLATQENAQPPVQIPVATKSRNADPVPSESEFVNRDQALPPAPAVLENAKAPEQPKTAQMKLPPPVVTKASSAESNALRSPEPASNSEVKSEELKPGEVAMSFDLNYKFGL